MSKEKQYRWNAEDYAQHSSAQQSWARELIAKPHLQGHESVLDIGCGDGRITAEIAGHLPDGDIRGVDNSAEMLAQARKGFLWSADPIFPDGFHPSSGIIPASFPPQAQELVKTPLCWQ